jgi:hypothetical protein
MLEFDIFQSITIRLDVNGLKKVCFSALTSTKKRFSWKKHGFPVILKIWKIKIWVKFCSSVFSKKLVLFTGFFSITSHEINPKIRNLDFPPQTKGVTLSTQGLQTRSVTQRISGTLRWRLSQCCFQKGVPCIKAASTNNSMSSQNSQNPSSSSQSLAGGRGRGGRPLQSLVRNLPAHSTGAAPLVVPASRPQVPHQIIQQCQEFLIQLAWQEVRSGVTTTVADQKNKLLESFQRFIALFLGNAIPATNASYPMCPEVLRSADRTAAVEKLNQSTGTGKASLTKESLFLWRRMSRIQPKK